jgi:Zn-dependent peptidase ImmA (M78 family)
LKKLPKIEPIVSDLLERSDINRPPVSMAKIARLWPGLEVTLEDIDGEGFILDLGRVGGQIMVKRETRLERQRYSVAHELGHWQLKQFGIPLNGSMQGNRDEAVERWCNRFASALLMPKAWVKRDLRGMQGLELLNRILELPGMYKVSRESVYIRIAEVSFINLMEMTWSGDSWNNRQYKSRLMPVDLDRYIVPLQAVLNRRQVTGSHVFEDENRMVFKTLRKDGRQCQWLVAFVQ